MTTILIKHASVLVTMDDHRREFRTMVFLFEMDSPGGLGAKVKKLNRV